MKIQDGLGQGYEAAVNSEGQVSTFSVVEAEDKHINKHIGKTWSVPFTVTPVGAGDYFFYFKNTSTENYLVTDIRVDAASADVVGVHWVSGTPTYTSDTDLTAYSRNSGVTLVPTATMKSDTDTTGLVDGGELYFLTCEANSLSHLRSSSNIIVTPGAAFALRATTGTATLKCMVSIVGTE